ncbi:ribosome assembly RNA-binding protein YhbY [Tissierella sp. Yu-01]|uniref:ribosome assembly RNA-binding protein YhbY n=1 Tax=Tissierella sp. Yu-01 TaxID=3035694 RepID=UPI00240DA6A2|nr:ribosome assembly RNA-binding protein YhbY [Tissierella sp. Yu-01]WFA09503.1 ribosome assembly RNA-binding protein YhbY [Tissierella sp. Yu-01]
MISGKQRSYLKSIANNIDPIFQLGKNGLTENFIKQIDDALETREIIKVNVLKNCDLNPTEVASQLAEELSAEFVQSIGRKFVIYRESIEHKKIELPK